ncbi:MAG: glycosyltransferase, partial [Rhodospirillales bacterium]|nr:glycosyltransferase [Rhodospirillales bacterium]
ERAAAMAIASSFPGAIAHADIPAALARMDLTVAPYLAQEDFYFSPLKVVESLAAGCPVVAPRIGQIPELVADGQTGLLYEPGDLAACRAAILRLLDDPAGRHRMGREAAARARRDWDWTRLADRVVRRAMRARAEALA